MSHLVVYNICEHAGKSNWNYYIPSIMSILTQDLSDFSLCISGCRITKETEMRLKYTFGTKISYSWVEEIIPLNTTFNHAVRREMNENDYESVIYIDSGIDLSNDKTYLSKLVNQYNKKQHSMIALQVDTDSGYPIWKINPPKDKPLDIPLGKTVNLHIQLFGREIYESYDKKILPDIFASDTSESVFTFMCAAINKKFCLMNNHPVKHKQGVDGPSIGFRGKKPLLYRNNKSIEQICAEGYPKGLGYEEFKPILKHNPSLYNEFGFHKNPEELRMFIKDNLFFENGDSFYSSLPGNFEKRKEFEKENVVESVFCLAYPSNTEFAQKFIISLKKQTFKNWKCLLFSHDKIEIEDERITVIVPEKSFIENMNYYSTNAPKKSIITYLKGEVEFYSNYFKTIIDFYNEKQTFKCVYSPQDLVSLSTNHMPIYIGEKNCSEIYGCGGSEISNGHLTISQISHVSDVSRNFFWHDIRNPEEQFLKELADRHSIYPIPIKSGICYDKLEII